MPSPFPGMNPYLEHTYTWQDFHQSFCTRLREVLVPQVQPNLFVKLEEHLFIHELPEAERVFIGRADVAVGIPTTTPRQHSSAAVGTLDPPAKVRIPPATDVERVPFLEIRDRENRTLITTIELLNPANKRVGADREAFVVKRRQLLASDVHYVEIDLLRRSPRMPMHDMSDCDYYVLVSRSANRPVMDMWPLRLRDRIPEIPIPLCRPYADAHVDLQAVLHHVYDTAGYALYLYEQDPEPHLNPEDEAWAQQLLTKSNGPS